MTLEGIEPPSNAAAMTSAGKSTCTPSEYRYASKGEYAGGGRAAAETSPELTVGDDCWLFRVVSSDVSARDDDRDCKCMSDVSGVGGMSFAMGESGGGRRTVMPAAASAAEFVRLCERLCDEGAGVGEGARDVSRDEPSEFVPESEPSLGGDLGKFAAAGIWAGVSVGEI